MDTHYSDAYMYVGLFRDDLKLSGSGEDADPVRATKIPVTAM